MQIWPASRPKKFYRYCRFTHWDEVEEEWCGWMIGVTPYIWKIAFDWDLREIRIGPIWFVGRVHFFDSGVRESE